MIKKGLSLFNVLFILALSGLLGSIVFLFQDAVINIWDESLYAINSIEMKQNGHFFHYTWRDIVDHHNTKPPLAIWMQVLSYSIFGFNEFAVRFPTYLALAATIFILILFSQKVFNNSLIGLLAAFFVLTSKALIRKHVFLTGDLDGVLVFFTTAFLLYSFYLAFSKKSDYSTKDYLIYFLLFVLGWFTKSTAILLILPSSVLPFLFYARIKKFFLTGNFYREPLFLQQQFVCIMPVVKWIRRGILK